MMDFIRDWLLSVTGVAILTAMAESMMPEGAVKRVGKLISGLVLLVAVLAPVFTLDLQGIEGESSEWSEEIQEQAQALEEAQRKQYKTIIETEFATYIVDKAEAQGIHCTAEVICEQADEIFLPNRVFITGIFQPRQKSLLISLVVEELGVPQEHIIITKEDMGEGD